MSRADKKPRKCKPLVEYKRRLFLEKHAKRFDELYSQGLMDVEIGEKMGFGASTITKHRQSKRLLPNKKNNKSHSAKTALTTAEASLIEGASIIAPIRLRVDTERMVRLAIDAQLREHFAERITINGEYRLDGRLSSQTKAIVAMQKERIDAGLSIVRFY